MRPEDMTVSELERELYRLEDERTDLAARWMDPDSEEDWREVNREIDQLTRLLKKKRSQ